MSKLSEHPKTDYDGIGSAYALTRRSDPRIAARIWDALGDAKSVVNVGAGTGSYEPTDREVVAVEPSGQMIRQRPRDAAPAIRAVAEALPLSNQSFDAVSAILTVHHWDDRSRGIAELLRVARRRVVILTWDEAVWESFWLVREYFPSIRDVDRRRAVDIQDLVATLGGGDVVPVPVPHDCVDGFHGAFWRRPNAYLDPAVRSGISTYALLSQQALDDGLRRLAKDLETGAWAKRHAELMDLDEIDLGYRLIVAELTA